MHEKFAPLTSKSFPCPCTSIFPRVSNRPNSSKGYNF